MHMGTSSCQVAPQGVYWFGFCQPEQTPHVGDGRRVGCEGNLQAAIVLAPREPCKPWI